MSDPFASRSTTSAAPAPKLVLFARGVIARLALWAALRVAVKENWGGPESKEKQQWLASVVVDAFDEQDPVPDAIYVEEMLLQIMEDEFDTVLEDDSAESVARDVVRLWEEVGQGKGELVAEFEARADKTTGKDVQVQQGAASDSEEEWSDDDDEEEEDEVPMLVDSPRQPAPPPKEEPEVDEDGFTTVKRKGRR